jgi:hypothetical protein
MWKQIKLFFLPEAHKPYVAKKTFVDTSPKSVMQRGVDRAIAEAGIKPNGLSTVAGISLYESINRQREANPYVGINIGKTEVLAKITNALAQSNPKGVHAESLFCILGALAGFSCQTALFFRCISEGKSVLMGLNVLGPCENGKCYFFGHALNDQLVEAKHSVWTLSAGYAQKLGCKDLPNLEELFDYVSSSYGKNNFGVPRYSNPTNTASDLPIVYLKNIWPVLLPTIKYFCPNPNEWPVLFGHVIQEAMEQTKDIIPPRDALVIVMESAVPMSKIDWI